jgi:hypothetical protein
LAIQIAKNLNICQAMVYIVAKEYNLQVATPPHKRKYDYDLIVKTYFENNQNGQTVDRILGMTFGETTRILNNLGLDHNRILGRPPEHKTPDILLEDHPDWKQIVELNTLEMSPIEIDRQLHIRHGKSSHVLRCLGIEHPGIGWNNFDKNVSEGDVVNRYLQGEDSKDIAKSYGHTDAVVYRILVKHNIPRRIGGASGSKNPQWKGGRSKEDRVHYYRRQSYEVSAICLGKPLPQGNIIHHLDENPKNNNPENLVIFVCQGDHLRFHQKVLKLQIEIPSEEATRLALENGAVKLPKPPAPIEL